MKTNTKNKLKSKLHDQFYTKEKTSDDLVNTLFQEFPYLKKGFYDFVEPSAGKGTFIDSLIKEKIPIKRIDAYDIDPKDNQNLKIKKLDFLEKNFSFNKHRIVIGNPPFGKRGKTAISFLNKCLDESLMVAFILPRTFLRYSVHKQIKQGAKLIYEKWLDDDIFVLNNRSYKVKCVFQVWVNKSFSKIYENYENKRLLKPLPSKCDDLKTMIHNNTVQTRKYFKKDIYEWNFAVHRQGFYDYTIKIKNPELLIENRQYFFVRYLKTWAKELVDKINFEQLSRRNTQVPGFSTTDFISEYLRLKNEKE